MSGLVVKAEALTASLGQAVALSHLLSRALSDEATIDALGVELRAFADISVREYAASLLESFLEGSILGGLNRTPASVVNASPEASARYLREALVEPTVRVLATAVDSVVALAEPVLPGAIAAGVFHDPGIPLEELVLEAVVGPRPERSRSRLTSIYLVTRAHLSPAQLEQVREFVTTVRLGTLLEAQGRTDALFLEAATKVVNAGGGLSERELIEAVAKVAKRFGLSGLELGDLARTQFDSGIIAEQLEDASRRALSPLVPAFPYFQYRDAGDDRVRENHHALDRFVARTDWLGWPAAEPPNGWNCRCRLFPIDWQTAQARGWSTDFPLGVDKLFDFLRLGGADEGFPKGQFASIAA